MVIDFWVFVYVNENLQQEVTTGKDKRQSIENSVSNHILKAVDDHIFVVIIKLWYNKRQPNEGSVYNHILKIVEFLTAILSEGRALV